MRRADLVISGLALLFGAVAFQQSLQYQFYGNTPGPGFLPRVLAAVIILLGMCLLISRLTGDPTRFGELPETSLSRLGRAGAVMGVITVGAILMPLLGFVAGMLFIIAGLLQGVERMWRIPALLTTVLIPTSLYLLFSIGLGVRLPTGIIGI